MYRFLLWWAFRHAAMLSGGDRLRELHERLERSLETGIWTYEDSRLFWEVAALGWQILAVEVFALTAAPILIFRPAYPMDDVLLRLFAFGVAFTVAGVASLVPPYSRVWYRRSKEPLIPRTQGWWTLTIQIPFALLVAVLLP